MAKIERTTQKIFAGASASTEKAVFGSMVTGSPVYTEDLATLQSDAYEQGWQNAIALNKAPFIEEMNGVQYGLSSQIAYILQQGMPEYDSGTAYYTNSFCTSDGVIYKSLTDDNLGNPVTDTVNWVSWYPTGIRDIGEPIITLSNTLNDNEIWLEGAEVSKTDYANLYSIYGDIYGTPTDEANFILPDFRNRALFGADDFGYLEAGLPNITASWGGTYLRQNGNTAPTGAATGTISSATTWGSNTNTAILAIGFNASNANSIYGNSDTVQPPAVKLRVKTRYA